MLLSNEFRPDVRVEKEAATLSNAGMEVTVLAWDRRRRLQAEERGEFLVRRVRAGNAGSNSGFFLNLPRFYLGLLGSARRARPEIVHAHDLDTLLPAVLISKLMGARLVYDAHEHYAEMVKGDVPTVVSRLLDRLERALVPNAELIIAANERIARYLRDWYQGIMVVVMNCIDAPPSLPEPATHGRKELVIFHGGSLEPLRYIEELMEAVERDPRLRFIVAGRGRLVDMVREASLRCSRIEFLGYVDKDKVYELTRTADAVTVLMDPMNKNNQIGTPNRLYEAMALGVPVLASKGTLAGEIVEKEGCGIAIAWSPKEFEAAIELLLDEEKRNEMAASGKQAASREYNWSSMRGRLLASYHHLDA